VSGPRDRELSSLCAGLLGHMVTRGASGAITADNWTALGSRPMYNTFLRCNQATRCARCNQAGTDDLLVS